MPKKRLLVVGGVAAGMSAASQARRRMPELEVLVFEQGDYVSYGACGMPYNIADPRRAIEDLVVITPEKFRNERNIEVRLRHRVEEIDLARQRISVRREGGRESFSYDWLVLATGCRPRELALPGVQLNGVFSLHHLEDAARIKQYLLQPGIKKAVLVGGGHIGLEMAEALTFRGLEVIVLDRLPATPPGYPEEITRLVKTELERNRVRFLGSAAVQAIDGRDRVERVVTDQGVVAADFVLLAAGVVPAVELARQAGIEIGPSGAIKVNPLQETSAPGVYSAGDCCEAWHLMLGRGEFIPRGTIANKQGRIAGANVAGAGEKFAGVVGTSITKVFDLEVGHTGLFEEQARLAGYQPATVSITASTRAHAFPGARKITVRLVFDRPSGKLLGGQLAGGEFVAKRLDVLAAGLQSGWTVEDLARLDASYAPPFAPVWDPLLVAANQARKEG
jgi:NADPH-dependent 2,4-dienoyl-CoA reductase/sulfur reductase-like enzyme